LDPPEGGGGSGSLSASEKDVGAGAIGRPSTGVSGALVQGLKAFSKQIRRGGKLGPAGGAGTLTAPGTPEQLAAADADRHASELLWVTVP